MKTMLGATFQMTGQVCMAIKRIDVPAKRRDEFIELFRKAGESLVVGDGLEPAVTMGPLHTRKAQVRAEGSWKMRCAAARRRAISAGSITRRRSRAVISCAP